MTLQPEEPHTHVLFTLAISEDTRANGTIELWKRVPPGQGEQNYALHIEGTPGVFELPVTGILTNETAIIEGLYNTIDLLTRAYRLAEKREEEEENP